LGPQESELDDERSNRRKNGTKMRRSLSGSKMSSKRCLSSTDRDREDAPKILERRTFEEILYVIFYFSTTLSSIKHIFCQFVSRIMESLRIHPTPFLEQPETVRERIPREETPQLGVSEGIKI
jgi:hypothetical protein